MSGAQNSSQISEFITKGRHEILNVFYNKQSYFGLTRRTIIRYCDRLVVFKQSLRDVQSMYYDIGAYDMQY